EIKPYGKKMPDQNRETGQRREVGEDLLDKQDGKRALAAVEQKRQRRELFIAGSQNIRRAYISGADLADIAIARHLCQQKAKRNSTQQVRKHKNGNLQVERHAAFSRLSSKSRTAMRTATPVSTCSRMTLNFGSSASALAISTSRLIG